MNPIPGRRLGGRPVITDPRLRLATVARWLSRPATARSRLAFRRRRLEQLLAAVDGRIVSGEHLAGVHEALLAVEVRGEARGRSCGLESVNRASQLEWEQSPILGTAYELAAGQRLGSGDFEGGKSGAVAVLRRLGFTVQERQAW
jgi:hypothetical protein